MTLAVIITFCVLLLLAYFFDLTSAKSGIPSVILLLITGVVLRQITEFLKIQLPDFNPALPVLGMIGLILIVLEAALELELNRSKLRLIIKSFLGALLPMALITIGLAFFFYFIGGYSMRVSLVNSIPISVISSSIAIPSVRNLSPANKEYVVYESSFSDILGVVIFNFVSFNRSYGTESFSHFGLQVIIIIIITVVATIILALLLHRIEHHIKYAPIILLIILIYALSEIWHLPALVFILLFGLFVGNIDKLKRYNWSRIFNPGELQKEVVRFKEITTEGAFLVKSIFFMIFGYSLQMEQILDTHTLIISLVIIAIIYFLRFIQLKISGLAVNPLLFVAPRGLITILLFLSVDASQRIDLMNESLMVKVIVITSLVMMFGMMFKPKEAVPKAKDPLLPDEISSEELENL
ncbi:MAG: cation:proton antiporter [Lentimicrobiaceae bacterium]|nr:cation:proton antiporter [Lentimicrobiaceae bacterium]